MCRLEHGLSPRLKISHTVIPNEYTSDSLVSLLRLVHLSGAIQGNLTKPMITAVNGNSVKG